jgi:NTE family protein
MDLFQASGQLPCNLDQVLEREKEIQYSSKQRLNIERVKELGELRGALMRLLSKLPDEMKADPDVKQLASVCDNRSWTVVRLINQRLPYVSRTKDYEFSRATVEEHWAAGREDVRRSVASGEWIKTNELVPGIRVFDVPCGESVGHD